jgi:hypothetical protein
VDRREIIAALDAEIARLRHARLLITESVVRGRQGDRPPGQHASTNSRKKMAPIAVREPLARTQPERRIEQEKEAAVPFTRLPAKEAPRPRVSRATPKHQIGLTANVPAGPVAAPGKKSPGSEAESEANLPAIASSASAFGQAIARGLATLHS